jgi:hypothetical protein
MLFTRMRTLVDQGTDELSGSGTFPHVTRRKSRSNKTSIGISLSKARQRAPTASVAVIILIEN